MRGAPGGRQTTRGSHFVKLLVAIATAGSGIVIGLGAPTPAAAATPMHVGVTPGVYVPVTPTRICDTRVGTAYCAKELLGSGAKMPVKVLGDALSGGGQIPTSGVSAVAVNLTAIGGTTNSLLTVWPSNLPQPSVSNLNFPPGIALANLVYVKVGNTGSVSVFNAAGTVNFTMDVEGYISNQTGPTAQGTSGLITPATPTRICDTRANTGTECSGLVGSGLGAGKCLMFKVAGVGPIPAMGVASVVVNLEAIAPTAGTFLATPSHEYVSNQRTHIGPQCQYW